MEHASYPHEPGTLYDCEACETECFCWELNHTLDGDARWLGTAQTECLACELDSQML